MANSFDYRTHHYSKDGKVNRETHYTMKIESGRKLMERPVGSGLWYAEDGSLAEDHSAEINAVRAQQEAEVVRLKEEQAQAAREKLKEELRQEIAAEAAEQSRKGGNHGSRPKV